MTDFSRRGFLQMSGAAAAAPSAQPNILFLMADQFRYDPDDPVPSLGGSPKALVC